MTKRCTESLVIAAMLIVIASPVGGQEGPVTFEFNFSNPGARSMGLGGAFAALADDATAAFANPAGLVQLLEPEFSVEGRSWSYDTPFVAGGRINGEASGTGLDTVDTLRFGTSISDITGFSFASIVYPREQWSFAFYHHTWADFELRNSIDGLFGDEDGELARSGDVNSRMNVKVLNTGFAAGYELSDELSIGLGLVYYEADMDSFSEEYSHDEETFFDPNPFTHQFLDTTYVHRGKDDGFSFHGGLLWRASPQWSFGAYYRQGPELTLHVLETVGPADDEKEEGEIDLDTSTPLHFPDIYGAGLAFRSNGGALTISFEWTRIEYSAISSSLDTTVFDPGQRRQSDADELHLGFEYVISRSKPIVALRLGGWHDPAHGVGPGPTSDIFEAKIFQEGDDQTHVTAGLGLVFDRFQIDIGYDHADRTDLASLSFVYRF